MEKKEFEELLGKGRDNLTVEERQKVAQFILNNEETKDICLIGALSSGNMNLAIGLMFGKPKLRT